MKSLPLATPKRNRVQNTALHPIDLLVSAFADIDARYQAVVLALRREASEEADMLSVIAG